PLAPPSPCSDITSTHQAAPAQLLVQAAAEIAAVLDLHALDVDVDATDAAVQRHHSLRPSLANEGQRWPSNDTATRHGRHPRRRHLEQRPLYPVALRNVADHATEAVVDPLGRQAQLLEALIELGAYFDDGLDLRVDGLHVERRAAEERVLCHLGQRHDLRRQHLGHERLDHGLPDAVANRFAQTLAEAGDVGLLERRRDAGREIISGNTESLDKVRYCALDLRLQFADLPLRGLDLRPNRLLGRSVTCAAAQEQADAGAQRAAEKEAQQPADDGAPSRGGRNLPLHAVQVLQQPLSLGDV